MTSSLGQLRTLILGISPEEATFARRGFHEGKSGARERLEQSGYAFIQGYHSALEDSTFEALVPHLNTIESELQGFAFEGAAMGLTLLDCLLPWRQRLHSFLEGPGSAHVYMVHVGVGWALARLHRRVERPLARLDPVLGWLTIDGYGFHEGYFHWHRYVGREGIPIQRPSYARRAFDQGLGRSLWFVDGADVDRIPATIASFSSSRQADLWSGIGLACAYAGGVDREDMAALRVAAGPYWSQLAQGAAFAAKARQRAGNPATHTDLACEVLCGLPSDIAAHITDVALQNLPLDDVEPGYEIWRRRIRARFAAQEVEA